MHLDQAEAALNEVAGIIALSMLAVDKLSDHVSKVCDDRHSYGEEFGDIEYSLRMARRRVSEVSDYLSSVNK